MRELLTLPGTRRTRDPVDTLRTISPRFREFGITRLADVTDLDYIGIPVVMSVRPQATTLSVSQGKGATMELAKVSAAMEAIELWHAENRVPAPAISRRSIAELSLPYDVARLDQFPGSLLTSASPLDWIEAHNLVDDSGTVVPRETVALGPPSDGWNTVRLVSSSNGLASGNTVDEATIHALYEVIERDCKSRVVRMPTARQRVVDPDSVTDPGCRQLLDRMRAAGAWMEIVDATVSRWNPIHCFVFHLWLPDSAMLAQGSGAHRDPAIALSRAITEAVQSRLTMIAGTRDDISSRVYGPVDVVAPRSTGNVVDWRDVVVADSTALTTDRAEAEWLVWRIWETVGQPPLRVDLTSPVDRDDFAVVRVQCPGLEFEPQHTFARRE